MLILTYQKGLLHLDGSDYYQSCELGVKLFRSAIERGEWANLLKQVELFLKNNLKKGYKKFKENEKKESLMYYLESSFIGDLTGQ